MSERPTSAQVRKAKKAELVAFCESLGLNAEGKVDELRGRILDYLDTPVEAETPEPAKAEPTEPEPAEEEAEEADEEVEGKGEGKEGTVAHTPKLKPKLDAATVQALRLRREVSGRRPEFHPQEWFRHPRLGLAWRKPQGMHSKLKRHFGYRPNVVSIGFRGPKAARGLHPSGFREVLVHNVRDLEAIDASVQAARIAGTVGTRKRLEIQAVADEKGIRVLNRREEE
jgi:large subunit ribosomal protein L32e